MAKVERYAIDWAAYSPEREEGTVQFRRISADEAEVEVEDKPATGPHPAHKTTVLSDVTYGGGRRITFPVKKPKDIDKVIEEVLRGDYPIG